MMRRTKDEEKLMSPMFPRLHVNDTEKGGPRAPPRNKMALYEQLSIPSQRLASGSASMLPLPHSGSGLIPSMSSRQNDDYERNVFTPFCNSPATSRLAENSVSYSSGGVKLNAGMASQGHASIIAKNDKSLNASPPLSLNAKCNSFHTNNFANFKNFSGKKIGDENDFRVPRSAQPGAAPNRSLTQHSKDRENQPHLGLSFSTQFKDSYEKQKKGTSAMDLKARSRNEETEKGAQTSQDSMERSASVPSMTDKTSVDASSSPSGKTKNSELFAGAHATSHHDCRSSSVDVQQSSICVNAPLNQRFGTIQDKTVHRDNHVLESAGVKDKDNPCKVGGNSYPRASIGGDKKSPSGLQNGDKGHNDKKCGSLVVGENKKGNDVLETSMVDFISTLEITPDDVVGVIGEQQFWKARRAIVNQQRVFAVQVFELHRLIKVQQLIAGSPHLLLEDNLYVRKASLKVSTVKKVPSEHAAEQPPLAVKPKDRSQKPHPSIEFGDENAVGKLLLPSGNNESKLVPSQSNYVSHSASATPAPMAVNDKPSPWCFPPPGNQWLVPVMSPTEGLVYKPYTGPCPPSAGFMAPAYGNYGPVSLTPGGGDFLSAAYGIPASHHQGIGIFPPTPSFGQNYFPPYVMPVMNPSISGSAVEQMSAFTGHRSKDNEFSAADINFLTSNQSSCNLSSQLSGAISHCGGKFRASKGSEVQGSTASSPFERSKGDALPLFPTEPTVQPSDQNTQTNEQRSQVIKVVPHNPRSAAESAAQIFKSIQEERKHYD